jgi:hypothetical protein
VIRGHTHFLEIYIKAELVSAEKPTKPIYQAYAKAVSIY